jgi:two-component system sensor histidine kinase KdpD
VEIPTSARRPRTLAAMSASANRLLRGEPPHPLVGLALTVATVVTTTLLVGALKHVAPAVSLGVVYLLGVLLVSTLTGLRLGLLAALLSAAAFNWFHLPPTHRFTLADSQNWVALAAFVVVAAVASTLAGLARARAREAEQRRREADLAADLARVLLGASDRAAALEQAGELVAASIGVDHVDIDPDTGAVRVSGRLEATTEDRLRERIAPAVRALVDVARQRDALHAEAVATAALHQSDELKTALLRTVSHDLRSPLTAIVTAGHALTSPSISAAERDELAHAVVGEGERLSRMIEKLLDLSRLQAGAAAPRVAEVALDDVLEAAVERIPEYADLRIASELPLLRGDAAQLERAFANLVENAVKHADGRTVQVRARVVGHRLVVRIVDQGRGMTPAESQHIFEPFYRGPQATPGSGSGLGLAIAKGFVEANGGTLRVESVPGQGTTFVVTFPLDPIAAMPA